MVASVRTQPPVMMPGMQTEVKTQATNLAANLSAVRESAAATLSGEIKGPQPEDFPALTKQASLEALFKCGEDAGALKEIFTNSNNVASKKAVMEFAGLFRSALNATSDSPAAKTLLMKVGAEYTAQIIKDGLKEKSAFGPWTPETKKAEAKLETLKNQLLDIIKNNTGGDFSKLSTNFVMQEVMPYIADCIEHNFGCTLDPLTRSNITQLVDKAAAKAVEALDMCHQKLTQEQGTSVGREARHLEMKTLIPLLLRNVFAQIPADKLPDPKIPEPAAGPVPDGGKKAEPTGININISIDSSNHSVDNSKHINNSRSHVDNSNHDNSRKTIDNSRTLIDNSQRHHESHYSTNSSSVSHSHSRVDSNSNQTEKAHSASTGVIDHGITGKIDVTAHATAEAVTNASSESTDGKVVTSEKGTMGETTSFDEVDGVTSKIIIGKPVQATVHGVDVNKEQSLTAESVDLKPLASQLAGVENVKIDTLQSETTVITDNKAGTTDNDNSQTDKAGPFSGLKFKQNGFLSVMPSVTNMHSMHFDARETFLGVIRKALEPDTSTPFPVRRAFDGLRAEILPNDSIKSAALKAQCSEINNHPELKAKMDTLKEVITHHPQKGKLVEIAQQFAREAGLTRLKAETDYVLSNVLDGLIEDGSWRNGPAFESYLNKPGVDRVVTTVDGLHMQH
ncbi:TPA: SPI-1 type III secretion system effector SipA [Salmonella enterica subsp. salamae serovar 51:c:-]|uniref:Pathogenicity island 1 effector protein SipA n=1 Tax=Salmonella enterica TaxID=28901 RepID=A0A379QYD8_SALER|nr:SPI-1 type III secretion system effector SipA [Salmonella enterica]EBP6683170.1 SPI-1 type III secretion system effector SipA [Salmonella enterica subsp. enterica]ECC9554950.1 type III secretion system effector SipA [Salmonella enterica subsp. salamae]HCM1930127.1 SPI-1 type III secretion system effector SipA [Salmonella enterica subsp. salamae serovar 51:c:-]ECE6304680.1 type III secretion system effector SipA [Salmonella enterica subsp. salamae]ECG1230833.1 type III secretion system effec